MSTSNRFGVIASYVHADARLGALVELSCESRAAARSHEVRELAHHLAMQVAATSPLVLRREDLTGQMREMQMHRLAEEGVRAGRPAEFAQRVAAARMEWLHEQACLLEQKFIKDESVTVRELLSAVSESLKEQLDVTRFVRFATDDGSLATGDVP
jgi:elongation factor Ts